MTNGKMNKTLHPGAPKSKAPKGTNLTQVALNLRNRIDACQKYYTGFEHADSTLENLKRLVK
jgi:hypothetical protein